MTPEERAKKVCEAFTPTYTHWGDLPQLVAAAIRDAVAARDAEWGAILLRISGGTQSEEAAFPCPDEASLKAFFARITA